MQNGSEDYWLEYTAFTKNDQVETSGGRSLHEKGITGFTLQLRVKGAFLFIGF
jgi:hypothetical protein